MLQQCLVSILLTVLSCWISSRKVPGSRCISAWRERTERKSGSVSSPQEFARLFFFWRVISGLSRQTIERGTTRCLPRRRYCIQMTYFHTKYQGGTARFPKTINTSLRSHSKRSRIIPGGVIPSHSISIHCQSKSQMHIILTHALKIK